MAQRLRIPEGLDKAHQFRHAFFNNTFAKPFAGETERISVAGRKILVVPH
jgi:hypothetical protein